MFDVPDLPYAIDALEPVMTARSLRFHHDNDHAGYIKSLNDQLEANGNPQNIGAVILYAAKNANYKLFNSAAQAWNHAFFWDAITPRHTAKWRAGRWDRTDIRRSFPPEKDFHRSWS